MNKSEIENWLEKHKITKYTIHPNLVVDVDGHVRLCNKKLESLPFQFGKVSGIFDCSYTKLPSLKGCPTFVSRGFYCANNNLASLQYCPTTVSGTFDCSNNDLPTLKYCPTTVTGNFVCSNNKRLTSLQYCPTTIGGDFVCHTNPFKVIPKDYASWIRAIKIGPRVYPEIEKQATPQMKIYHELRWG